MYVMRARRERRKGGGDGRVGLAKRGNEIYDVWLTLSLFSLLNSLLKKRRRDDEITMSGAPPSVERRVAERQRI